MTTRQIQLVQESFATVGPVAEQVGGLFYARLFELDPALRGLFSGEMAAQSRKLVDMLTFAVTQLDRPELLRQALRQLGARHVGYGVREPHYRTVGEALIWTLRQALGPSFTAELEQAWTTLYQLVAQTMLEGARAQAA